MNHYLGSEQLPGPWIARGINPTDFDLAVAWMYGEIKNYYSGIDWLNPVLWRLLGGVMTTDPKPLREFLMGYVTLAREKRQAADETNLGWFKQTMNARYLIPMEDLDVYFRALVSGGRGGTISDIIYRPWDYTPETLSDVIGENAGTFAVRTAAPLLIVAAVGAGLYLTWPLLMRKRRRASPAMA